MKSLIYKILNPLLFSILIFLGNFGVSYANFTFTAVGDYFATADTDRVLNGIKTANPALNIALGDFNYDPNVTETAWCDYIKSHLGSDLPFELIAGNHDADGGQGSIDEFIKCLPNKISNLTGIYGKEYYFDYDGTTRFILASPNLTFNGVYYDYSLGTSHYSWISNAIDSARQSGIKWIVVATHEPCVNIENATCWIGVDLTNLLVRKKVDVVLQAHSHNYERSKQLSLSDSGCTVIGDGSYNSKCVVANLDSNRYPKGAGTVFVAAGTGGRNLSYVDLADGELPYFAAWSAGNSNPAFGFLKLSVTADTLTSEFISVGPTTTYYDSVTLDANLPVSSEVNLISKGASWKYFDNGTDQGTTWRDSGFDDTAWKTGLAQLGYGDGDETTVINGNGKTAYFRKDFNIDNINQVQALQVNLVRDDGAVVYINGQEAVRTNMPEGTINFNTLASVTASSPQENYFNSFNLPSNLLTTGRNVIAIEMHQVSSSTDISFDLELKANTTAVITPTPTPTPTPMPTEAPTPTPSPTPTPTPTPSPTPISTPTPTVTPSPTPIPTPTPISSNKVFIEKGSEWRYLDNGSNQGTNWKNSGFNDSLWKTGLAQFGYGDGDEKTIISFGNSNRRYITSYYRKAFQVLDANLLKSLDIRMLRDDGAVVYINGVQVRISNMRPGGLDYLTLADKNINGVDENSYGSKIIEPKGIVVEGPNVIAVELHQESDKSNDASFDLEMVGTY